MDYERQDSHISTIAGTLLTADYTNQQKRDLIMEKRTTQWMNNKKLL